MSNFRRIAPKDDGQASPETDTSIPKRSRNQHDDVRWEAVRPVITRLYIHENRSADEVIAMLRSDPENPFITSRRQLFVKLNEWGLKKNNKKRSREQDSEDERERAGPSVRVEPSSSSSANSFSQNSSTGATASQHIPDSTQSSVIPTETPDIRFGEDRQETSEDDDTMLEERRRRLNDLAYKFSLQYTQSRLPSTGSRVRLDCLRDRGSTITDDGFATEDEDDNLSSISSTWTDDESDIEDEGARPCFNPRPQPTYRSHANMCQVHEEPDLNLAIDSFDLAFLSIDGCDEENPLPLNRIRPVPQSSRSSATGHFDRESQSGSTSPLSGPDALAARWNRYLRENSRTNQKRDRLRMFRRNFIGQSNLLRHSLQDGSSELRSLGDGIQNHRETWHLAIRTMRSLLGLEIPTNSLDAMSFLCLARAVIETVQDDQDAHMSEFIQDLENWRQVYPLVEDVARSMWGVTMDHVPPSASSRDSSWHESIFRLRESVASLLGKSVDMFGLDSGCSRAHEGTPSQSSRSARLDGVGLDHVQFWLSDNDGSQQRQPHDRARTPNDPIYPNLSRLYHFSSRNARHSAAAVSLATGAMFAIIISFILRFVHPCTDMGSRPSGAFNLNTRWCPVPPPAEPGDRGDPVAVRVFLSAVDDPDPETPVASRSSSPGLSRWEPDLHVTPTTASPDSAETGDEFPFDLETEFSKYVRRFSE